jgi:hypothetical protein
MAYLSSYTNSSPKTRQAGQATVSGAVAGALVSKTVRNYILEKGFYVIEQTGDTVRINIPKGFKARNW